MRVTLPTGGHRLYDWLVGRPLAKFYARLAADLPSGRVLDVGCGPGHLAAAVMEQGRDVVAVDLDPRQVQIAKSNHSGLDVRVGDAAALPFDDGAFDVVVTSESYHHWPDTDAGASEARRVLRSGGHFVVIEGAADVKKEEVKDFLGHRAWPGMTLVARAVFRNHGYGPEGLETKVVSVLAKHFDDVQVERVAGWWVVTAS